MSDSAEVSKPRFNTVGFVLFGIFMACSIFPALIFLGPSFFGPIALSLLVWVALPHAIGLYLSIRDGHTVSAIIICLFLGFWLYLGIGLLMPFSGKISPLLIFIEPGIILAVFFLQYFYRDKDKKILQHVLWGLGFTVTYLWLSKFFHFLHGGIPYVVWGLGVWVLYVAMTVLKRSEKTKK